MIRLLIIAVLLAVLIFGVAIGFYNATPVTFDYLAGQLQVPLIGLVLGEFVLVALLTLLICGARILSLRGEIRRLRRQIKDAQAELQSLRNLPLLSLIHI